MNFRTSLLMYRRNFFHKNIPRKYNKHYSQALIINIEQISLTRPLTYEYSFTVLPLVIQNYKRPKGWQFTEPQLH